jgi:hypothetical protein
MYSDVELESKESNFIRTYEGSSNLTILCSSGHTRR